MGESTRPLADLTAPLALGVAEVPARRCPRLSGRGSPPGFRVCSTTAHALRAPGKPGSLSTACNGQGGEAPELLHKKGTQSGAFLHGINEPSAWKTFDLESLFSFFLRSAKANKGKIIIYWIVVSCEKYLTTHDVVTSLVRRRAK